MKKLILFFSFLLLINCSDTGFTNECFSNFTFGATVNLSLPEFINIQTIEGKTITYLNGRDILIINRSSRYQAFDLACPEADCSSRMTLEDDFFITCPCSEKQYSSLNGFPQDGEGCSALEYNVLWNSNNMLQISY